MDQTPTKRPRMSEEISSHPYGEGSFSCASLDNQVFDRPDLKSLASRDDKPQNTQNDDKSNVNGRTPKEEGSDDVMLISQPIDLIARNQLTKSTQSTDGEANDGEESDDEGDGAEGDDEESGDERDGEAGDDEESDDEGIGEEGDDEESDDEGDGAEGDDEESGDDIVIPQPIDVIPQLIDLTQPTDDEEGSDDDVVLISQPIDLIDLSTQSTDDEEGDDDDVIFISHIIRPPRTEI